DVRGGTHQLRRSEQPIRAQGVGVQVDARGSRRPEPAVWRVVALLGAGHASQTCWIRSLASARPVAGSMSTWVALKMTEPSPTSNLVGRPLRNRGRTVAGSKPMIDHAGPVQPRSLW